MSKIVLGLIHAVSIGLTVFLRVAPSQAYPLWHDDYYRDTVYPGSVCKYYGVTASDTFFTVYGGKGNGLRNTDSIYHAVTCPVQRDFYTNHTHSAFGYAMINVSGTSWTLADCELWAVAWDGTSSWVGPTPTLTATSGGVNSQYKWTSWAPAAYSTMAVVCDVPPGQWIRKIETRIPYPDFMGEL